MSPIRAGAGIRRLLSVALVIAGLAAIGWIAVGRVDDTAGGREAWRDPVVVDGDTISATNDDGATWRIRILGIDAPEWDECGGAEATAALTELLAGVETIYTERDPSQVAIDAYGRVLAYVELDDGTDVGAELIAGGYANEYTYGGNPHARAAQYREIQHSTVVGC